MIRIEGRNILDEGFSGSNARDMDTGRMSKEAATFLTDTIKKAIAPIENTVKTNKVVIAQTASNMAKVIGENTKEFQTIIQESSEDTQKELLKLLTMMNDAQKKTGDASIVAMKDVVKQIEKLKQSDASGRLTSALDLDKRQKEIAKPLGRQTVFGAAFKKFTNVDLRRESALQALSPTKLFGLDPGSGDVIKRAQTDVATSGATGALGQLGAALLPSNDTPSKKTATVTAPVKNAEGGQVFTTGIDRESLENKQVELLEQILAQLKEMESLNSSKGMFGALAGMATGAALGTIMMSALAGFLGLAGAAGIVAALIGLVKSNYVETTAEPILNNRDDMYKAGLGFSDEDMQRRAEFANRPIEKAKSSGLYDKDYVGNSEVDLNKLAETTDISQLQAILEDNDLSSQDQMRVQRRIEQIKRETTVTPEIDGRRPSTEPTVTPEIYGRRPSTEPTFLPGPSSSSDSAVKAEVEKKPYIMNIAAKDVLSFAAELNLLDRINAINTPTGDAVLKTTETAGSSSLQQGTTVVNNVTNNNTTTGSTSSPIIVAPDGSRNPRMPYTWADIRDSFM